MFPASGSPVHDVRKEESNASSRGQTLYTIGYEGLDFEEYLRRLLENGIRVVVDVRRDPVSRKPGFSRKGMAERLGTAGIRYEHFPMLGIEKERRRLIHTAEDREFLFGWYREEVLKLHEDVLRSLLQMIDRERRIALTCYESEPGECHRSVLASKLVELGLDGIECIHL